MCKVVAYITTDYLICYSYLYYSFIVKPKIRRVLRKCYMRRTLFLFLFRKTDQKLNKNNYAKMFVENSYNYFHVRMSLRF